MTSRKSSLSLAQPIQMAGDCQQVDNNCDPHKIDRMFIPSNEQMNGHTSLEDIQLHQDGETGEHVKTVL